jgi:hypothetical protein
VCWLERDVVVATGADSDRCGLEVLVVDRDVAAL